MVEYGAKNMKELEKMIEKQIVNWMVSIGKKLPKYLEEFIHSEFYDQYEPSDLYDRKYRIIEAITVTSVKKQGDTYTLSIYLDPSKVSYDPSIWYDRKLGTWNYIKGDTSEYVFNLIANGIHGDAEFGETDGRFWETFLDSIDAGGIYDIFDDFKKWLGNKGILTIR
jgi:hypothetical protein